MKMSGHLSSWIRTTQPVCVIVPPYREVTLPTRRRQQDGLRRIRHRWRSGRSSSLPFRRRRSLVCRPCASCIIFLFPKTSDLRFMRYSRGAGVIRTGRVDPGVLAFLARSSLRVLDGLDLVQEPNAAQGLMEFDRSW